MTIEYKYAANDGNPPITIIKTDTENTAILTAIPMVIENTDYAEIMRQVDAGELTIADAD
jgi:hypothetical protein|tara:strand:- start:267 stop:446 length:180 start_codon:yes stop_codon:yes gene_type:complete